MLDAKYHRWLLEAFATRIVSDYGVDAVIEPAEVNGSIRRAQEFLQVARDHLHGEHAAG